MSYDTSPGRGSHETDFRDGGNSVTEPLDASTQVTSLREEFGLDRRGSFLDPKKYDPIKHLGYGGFAEACLLNTYTLVVVSAIHVAEILIFHDKYQKQLTRKNTCELYYVDA